MQLFDAIENCFPAMEKQYQEICPPPEDFFSSSFVPIAVTPLYELPVRKAPRRRWPGA